MLFTTHADHAAPLIDLKIRRSKMPTRGAAAFKSLPGGKRNTVQRSKVVGTFHVARPSKKPGFLRISGRHTEYACYFSNGIAVKHVLIETI